MATRVFLCNREEWYHDVEDEIKAAKQNLSQGDIHRSSWSCGNVRAIQVSDRAYFQRVGSNPRGFFAYGRLIPAERDYQLRLRSPKDKNLSEAYTDIHGDLRITYEWYSVVDYNQPLEIEWLKRKPEFSGANFKFQGSGGSFREEYVELLDKYWEQHVLKLSKQGHGVHLAEVYYQRGQHNSNRRLYKEAVGNYTQSILTNPKYAKAYVCRGNAYHKLRDNQRAIEDYTQAIRLKSSLDGVAYYRRGIARSELGDIYKQEAVEDLQKASQLFFEKEDTVNTQKVQDKLRELTLNNTPENSAFKASQELPHTSDSSSTVVNRTDAPPVNEPIADTSLEAAVIEERHEIPETINQTFTAEVEDLAAAKDQLDAEGYFTAKSIKEAKERITRSIARRQGQSKFRQSLLEAYDYRCAITGCDAQEALEAAHIIPYCETENNHPSNGLLLRADLHTLFDLDLIAINPETLKVHIALSLRPTSYRELEGKSLQLPKNKTYLPRKDALKWHYNQCAW